MVKWYRSKMLWLMLVAFLSIGCIVYGMAEQIRTQMEKAATENVREIVQIIESSISELRENDIALAKQCAALFPADEDAEAALRRLQAESPFARISFVRAGSVSGVSSDGERFSLDTPPYVETALHGEQSVSDVYMSDLGAWMYTIQCPVYEEGELAGALYADMLMERYDHILPGTIYQGEGIVYILDTETLRFIYEPTNTQVIISSKYDLHGFLNDFGILDAAMKQSISDAIGERKNTIAKVRIDQEAAYMYFWPVDQGKWYVCGIIPERSIQGESKAVMQTIAAVSVIIFGTAVLLFGLFYWNNRRSQKVRQYQIELFNGIAKSIDDVVLLYDCDAGKLEVAFDNIERILGLNRELLGELVAGKEMPKPFQAERLPKLLRSEGFQEQRNISDKIEWSNPKTGAKQWLEVETTYVIITGTNKCILSIRDITKEEQMQESLRTSVLAAQNASQVKSDFLSRMSHEIRTPMNAVLGMAQIAKRRVDDRERVVDCLDKIESSSQHLLGLINDILDISKIESQKLSLSEDWFALDGLVSDVADMVTVQAGLRGQAFIIDNQAGAVELLADRIRLSQVLMNLLNNAVKYTPEGGRIALSISRSPSKVKNYCLIGFQIADNGIGMSPAFQQKLFTPFEREDDQAVRAQTGTGLGLAIVQSMVSLMGGSIRVESEKGVGTTFYVDINFQYKAVQSLAEDTIAEQAAVDLTGVVILLAEDNALNREIAIEFLHMVNAQVESAVDGKDAYEKFAASAEGYYQLILMDMQMPRWDGLEATRQIRRLDRADAKAIPILAVTANAYSEDEQRCLDAGMNDHVSKPLEMQDFYQKIKTYLGDKH